MSGYVVVQLRSGAGWWCEDVRTGRFERCVFKLEGRWCGERRGGRIDTAGT